MEVTGRRGRRPKHLPNGCWKLKEETQARTLWRTRFGIGYGRVTTLHNECLLSRLVVLLVPLSQFSDPSKSLLKSGMSKSELSVRICSYVLRRWFLT
jgi:hypothetical protein